MICHTTRCSTFRYNLRTIRSSLAFLLSLLLLVEPVAWAGKPLQWLSAQVGPPAAQAKREVWPLEPGKALEVKVDVEKKTGLLAAAHHYYQMTLPASDASEGKALIVTVEPHDAKVYLELHGTDDNNVLKPV